MGGHVIAQFEELFADSDWYENGSGILLDVDLNQADWAVCHAATAVPRTRSSTAINSSTCFAVNSPSGPLGVRSVKGDS